MKKIWIVEMWVRKHWWSKLYTCRYDIGFEDYKDAEAFQTMLYSNLRREGIITNDNQIKKSTINAILITEAKK
jgi:hypothetical protein